MSQNKLLHVLLPMALYDALVKEAKREQRTVSGFARVLIARAIPLAGGKEDVGTQEEAPKKRGRKKAATKESGEEIADIPGRIRHLLMDYCAKFKMATGNHYPLTWGKETILMKQVAKKLSDIDLHAAMDGHFADDYCRSTCGFSIPVFVKFLPKYLSVTGVQEEGWKDELKKMEAA